MAQTYAPSLITRDASNLPIMPTDQQINDLAQQHGVDPAIMKSAVQQQFEDVTFKRNFDS